MAVTGVYSFLKERSALALLTNFLALVPHDTIVIRNGERITLSSDQLVVGDVVELKYGDNVPADIRVFQVAQFKVFTNTTHTLRPNLLDFQRDLLTLNAL
jgi:sodium/potassium-transporting ATPase subunit alpha